MNWKSKAAGGLALAAAAALLAACGSTPAANGGGGGGSSSSKSPIIVGELFPMTGREPFVGQWFLHGAKAGIYDVNHNGGVMGHPLQAVLADTGGDPVDAVPAWRQLETHNPTFELGPSSLEIMGVIKLYDPAHLVDFMEGGTTQVDHMQYKYVWRTTPSDSTMAKAMAYYALQKHYTRAAFLFESTSNAQTLVPPLIDAYTRHGGTVVANIQLVPHQSSYRSEVLQAFQNHPDCVFIQTDPQTASTLFANIKQLGDLNVPFIGTDAGATIEFAKAMGLSDASRWLVGMAGAPPSGPAWSHYVQVYQKVWGSNQPVELSQNTYDAVIIAALAMTAAHSTDPKVWVNDITKVSNPPGVPVYTYAQGVKELQAGKKINYEGATGPDDFNQYHNVFGGWDVAQFDTSGNLHPVFHVTAQDIQNF
ncbi:MAG: ABC transporter substrate-binding protein [Actinomycetia bacterium]|nr:ABC transporter substrate-binding protein [Actinomycetes bacterium]